MSNIRDVKANLFEGAFNWEHIANDRVIKQQEMLIKYVFNMFNSLPQPDILQYPQTCANKIYLCKYVHKYSNGKRIKTDYKILSSFVLYAFENIIAKYIIVNPIILYHIEKRNENTYLPFLQYLKDIKHPLFTPDAFQATLKLACKNDIFNTLMVIKIEYDNEKNGVRYIDRKPLGLFFHCYNNQLYDYIKSIDHVCNHTCYMRQFLDKLSNAISIYITNNLKVFKNKSDFEMTHYVASNFNNHVFFYHESLSSNEFSTHIISNKKYNLIALYAKLKFNLFIYHNPETNHYQCITIKYNPNEIVYCDLYVCLGYIFQTD